MPQNLLATGSIKSVSLRLLTAKQDSMVKVKRAIQLFFVSGVTYNRKCLKGKKISFAFRTGNLPADN